MIHVPNMKSYHYSPVIIDYKSYIRNPRKIENNKIKIENIIYNILENMFTVKKIERDIFGRLYERVDNICKIGISQLHFKFEKYFNNNLINFNFFNESGIFKDLNDIKMTGKYTIKSSKFKKILFDNII